MRILVVGNGGREHALLWKMRRDEPRARLWATRPNGGMIDLCRPVDIAPMDTKAIARWAAERAMDLVVVGPEAPLAAGLVDDLARVGVSAFGPSARAARIEADKAFAKDLMASAGVPTAAYEVHTDPDQAARFIREMGAPVVVKASGLAAGKGAVVCETTREAVKMARAMLAGSLGAAGERVVIEEFMEGEELSCLYLVDGQEYAPLLPSQDHKRVGEGDTGPNTGGMGAYAPVSVAAPELLAQVSERIVAPLLRALAQRESSFSGVLYAGLMIRPDGPSVVEFNCRFGDPEAQAILPLMESSLVERMVSIAGGAGVGDDAATFAPGAAVATVLAAPGYPGAYPTGTPIAVPELRPGVHCFHAGSTWAGSQLVTSGGRVMAVTAVAEDFARAHRRSLEGARAISFPGKQFRSDIGWREAKRRA